ncbi:ankyrin repeat domain-containing protein 26-like [Parus major]|uniref:ankyrin repeat domain-containing protein 26-like n=1 Tax=Parus major TaxID=9157 RepID=UPI0014440825|nr:ankyrin repeat domain-containing protein 26-like [Parus major]
MQHLGFEKSSLEATVQQQRNKIEALQRDLQATTSEKAAIQDFIKQSRPSHHDSLTNQLKDRIRDLECELDKIKNTQQESTLQKQCTQAEVEKYKELYLEEVKISKCEAKELERHVHIFLSGNNNSDSCFLIHLPSKSHFSTCSVSGVEA